MSYIEKLKDFVIPEPENPFADILAEINEKLAVARKEIMNPMNSNMR
jgi:hypothetical protein